MPCLSTPGLTHSISTSIIRSQHLNDVYSVLTGDMIFSKIENLRVIIVALRQGMPCLYGFGGYFLTGVKS
ncbi:hypothetical protein FUAX_43600 (plasmid) [Fulvitalea axinellae]|uniref:Uncharacterized protein n=1 Tax=Fulvitalea axinellae TaxID=1182444 RepID=A0AAU9CV73_9BACT|nr:hypothetical protein FUAX_43600 [Fulvitalea axinellae]